MFVFFLCLLPPGEPRIALAQIDPLRINQMKIKQGGNSPVNIELKVYEFSVAKNKLEFNTFLINEFSGSSIMSSWLDWSISPSHMSSELCK